MEKQIIIDRLIDLRTKNMYNNFKYQAINECIEVINKIPDSDDELDPEEDDCK